MKESYDVLILKHQITIDPTPVPSKPPQEIRGKIQSQVINVVDVTIDEFSQLVTPPYSFTWSGGIFNGKPKTENWISQSVFGLDFDRGEISVQAVYDRLIEYGITPQLWYETFSSSDSLIKFRVILFLDEPISNLKLRQFITKELLKLFPEADQSCSDAARYYFGGINSTITSHTPTPTTLINDMAGIISCVSNSKRLRKVPIQDINEHNELFAPKRAYLYDIYRNNHFGANYNLPPPTSERGGKLERIDFKVSKKNIRIFREFIHGEWLDHIKLFGLASNLQYVNGGLKLMKDTMNKFNSLGTTDYTQNNFAILTYLKSIKYPPQPIREFSHYQEDKELHDLISETKNKRGHIKILEPINRLTLNEAEEKFKSKFDEVINNDEVGKIYLFKVPTSIGKTQLITNTHSIIAAPTNDLKNEIGERMKVNYVMTPDPIEFENTSLNNQIKYYYSIGQPKKSMEVIHSVTNPKNRDYHSEMDINKAKEYLRHLNESYNTTSTLLTTHDRVIYSEYNNDTLIFDEDPLKTLISIKELRISDLFIVNQTTKNKALEGVINKLNSLSPLEIVKTPLFGINIDEIIQSVSSLSKQEIGSNIFDFFSSDYMVKSQRNENTIHYVIRRDLPLLKKVIILSASAPIEIYKVLFGNRLEVIDISDVENQGRIIQDTTKSFSRNSLKNNYKEISKEVGDRPVITYKSYRGLFNNPSEMWFGNCSGYDTLKGQDICVVGTPHLNNIVYLLTAKSIGLEFKTSETLFYTHKVRYNGFEFIFNCFEDENLRKIQFSFIESDLIQSVGRSRTLRTDATVNLFSNFPLRISTEFKF